MALRPIDADGLRDNITDIYGGSDRLIYLADVLSLIDAQPTLTPPNEWLRVEERLPGMSGNYICAAKDKNGSVWTIPAEWSLEMKMWFGAFGEIKNIVTHWMPLPKSPKEDE